MRVLSWPGSWFTRLRDQAAERARWRALRNLSDSTLRDIGLFDEMPPRQPGVSAIVYERGRWS
ncbi:MAG: hypothetical protein LH480_15095 [Rubrivivax sp.]|nr:hypothetical protein [Rubrivivax sp.]